MTTIKMAKATGQDIEDQIDPLLGTAPDTEIANRFQISQSSVSDRRKSLKIAVFKNTPTL